MSITDTVRRCRPCLLETVAFQPLAQQLAMTANGFSPLTRTLFGRLFEMPAKFHFAENTFTLHFFLQRAKSLIHIVISNNNLHVSHLLFSLQSNKTNAQRAYTCQVGAFCRPCARLNPGRGQRISCCVGIVKPQKRLKADGFTRKFEVETEPAMAILKIAKMGHPVLRRVADPLPDPTHPAVADLIHDMIDTMYEAEGTGLAAPQVHMPVRLLVYQVSKNRLEPGEDAVPLTALINPTMELLDSDIVYDWEGCLSVPGMTGLVPRHSSVRLQAILETGEEIDEEIHGFHARVLQHEYDHLDGILYPQRMDDMSLLLFNDEMKRGIPERAYILMGKEPEDDGKESIG